MAVNRPTYVDPLDPNETLDNEVDFTDRLGGLTIDSADVVNPTNLTIVSFSFTDTSVIVRVSNGLEGAIGEFTARANVSNGQVFDQTVKMKIRNK